MIEHDDCDRRDSIGLPTCPACLYAFNMRPHNLPEYTPPADGEHDPETCGLTDPPVCPECLKDYLDKRR